MGPFVLQKGPPCRVWEGKEQCVAQPPVYICPAPRLASARAPKDTLACKEVFIYGIMGLILLPHNTVSARNKPILAKVVSPGKPVAGLGCDKPLEWSRSVTWQSADSGWEDKLAAGQDRL